MKAGYLYLVVKKETDHGFEVDELIECVQDALPGTVLNYLNGKIQPGFECRNDYSGTWWIAPHEVVEIGEI